jgi:streptogramin lyase
MSRSKVAIRTVIVGLLMVLSVGLVTPPAGAATGDVTEFTVPTAVSLPQGIAVGSDGAVWFAERSANAIGRLENGSFSEYPLPITGSTPFWVATGPDGNVWFTERSGNRIGRITPTGVLTEYSIPTSNSQPAGITAGPDGAMWFTEQAITGNRIGRITTAGQITEFTLPHASSGPFGITAGPDSALWFTEQTTTTGNRIGRITTAGQITEFPLLFSNRQPADITVGGDGNLWFTERAGNAIGRISTGGSIDEFVVPTATPNPVGIAAGPDGNVWFAELGGNSIGRITPDGTITEFPLPNANSQPFAIALGADGAMWFTESAGNRIGRLQVQATPPPDTTPPTVTITSPADGSVFTVGQVVLADYGCEDEVGGLGVATCDGPVVTGSPIDTSLGTHTFIVSATDVAGNPAEASTTYLVSPPPDTTAPTVTITSPADGSVFTVGQVVLADYGCTDEVGGSALATCGGPVVTGSPIDTSLGTHTFSVSTTDVAGNETVRTTSYAVLGNLGGPLRPAPAWNQATAGSALALSFDLGPAVGAARSKLGTRPGRSGDEAIAGLFAAGFPMTQAVDCGDPATAIGPAQTPNVDVHVTKDGRFHLVWKSEERWAGSCRALVLRFDVAGWRDASLAFFLNFH